jgi:hypothetical protein
MKSLLLGLCAAITLGACATPGIGERTKLTREELGTMRPQIAEHLTCMAKNATVYSKGTADLGVLVDTAAYTCRSKLGPLAAGLKNFNLTPDAQKSYVQAVEMASRSIIADRIVKAQTGSPKLSAE